MVGGAGNDTYVVDNAGDVVTEAAGEGTDTVQSSIDYTLGANVENLTLTGAAVLRHRQRRRQRHDRQRRRQRSRWSWRQRHARRRRRRPTCMIGGLGNDTYVVDNAGDFVVENANEGTDTVNASTHYRLAANVENLTLHGRRRPARLRQQPRQHAHRQYRQQCPRRRRRRRHHARRGRQRRLLRRQCRRSVIENAGEGNDTVFSTAHFRLSANVENLVLQGSADLQGYGNSLSNLIYGNAGNNILDGGAGADAMYRRRRQRRLLRRQCRRLQWSRTPAKAPIRCSRPPISGWRRTWKIWSCKAVPTCRATATA